LPGAPDTPDAIEGSKSYLRDYSRLKDSGQPNEQVFEKMVRLYPDWASPQPWLMFGFPLDTIPEH
jgi:hypothetical protein